MNLTKTLRRPRVVPGGHGWLACYALSLLTLLTSAAWGQSTEYLAAREAFHRGDLQECLAKTTLAIQEGSYNPRWWQLQIDAQMRQGDYLAAWDSFESGRKKFSYSIQLLWRGRDIIRRCGTAKEAAELQAEFDRAVSDNAWRYTDAEDLVLRGKRAMERGGDAKEALETYFDRATRQSPRSVAAWRAIGELGLMKHDYGLAADGFRKALEAEPDNPDVMFGLARALRSSDPDQAQQLFDKALEINPNHPELLLFLAERQITAEDFAGAEEQLEKVLEINPEHAVAWAYRSVIAHFQNRLEDEQLFREIALGWWKANPEVDYEIGRKLSENYRFAEGAEYQRKSLALKPDYLPARLQLAQDLLRLGDEEAGWQYADGVFADDPYNTVALNLLNLRDNLNKYATLRSQHFVLRMESREAAIYGEEVLKLLEEAFDVLTAKYDVTITQPVIVEVFARQEDFAIRTFGLPGGLGYLGVCFGNVVTANSPAAQQSPSNWEAVLWHEFCHVVTLTKTRNKMPRWLSEGISVYEELERDPSWGQRMNVTYRQMVLDELTPVSQLSSAFLRPPSGMHLQFAYFEAYLVVKYIVDNHGIETLRAILDDLGDGEEINATLSRHVAPIERLDQQFQMFAVQQAESLGERVDWSEPEETVLENEATIRQGLKAKPRNYALWRALAARHKRAGKTEELISTLDDLLKIYPEDLAALNELANAHGELGNTRQRLDTLQQLIKIDADNIEAQLELALQAVADEDWKLAAEMARKTLAVQPLIAEPYRVLGQASMAEDQRADAIRAYEALSLLDQTDPAETHFRLGSLLQEEGQLLAAQQELAKACEEAPRYRAALKKLLEVNRMLQDQQTPAEEKKE